MATVKNSTKKATANATKKTKCTLDDLTALKSTDNANITFTSELVKVTAKVGGKVNVFSVQPHREKFAYSHGVSGEIVAPFFTVFTAFTVEPLAGDVFVANGNASDSKRPHILAVKTVESLQRYIDALNFADMTCMACEPAATTK